MKTAVSVPDPVFEAADELARWLRISRSELYAKAAQDFVRKHRSQGVTAQLNRVYAKRSSRPDRVLARMQAASTRRDPW